MRNVKKLLAVLVVVAVMASMFVVPAFAETTVSDEAKACETLGMLIGRGDGVTAEYTAEKVDRVQLALIFLRLQGVDKEALAYEGEDNFADAKDFAPWGRPVMAYLKDNPEYGFEGVGNNKFAPNAKITAQMYAKVLLNALGYTVGTTEDADIQYADAIAEAGKLGIASLKDKAEITIDDVAVATVEALTATVKGGTVTLLEQLIADEIISEAKAIESGLYNSYVALDVKAVTALTNTKVKVELNTAAKVVDVAKFAIKDSASKALEIKSATLSADGKSVIVVTVAQTAFTAYTLTVDGTTKSFVAVPADTTKPTAVGVVTSNTEVTVTFNEEVDAATATSIANYVIDNGLAVLKAELDSTGTIVTLTTSSQTVGTIYTLTVKNIADIAGNVMDKYEVLFGGYAKDTTKPTAAAVVVANTLVEVTFNEKVDKATAENIANYAIDNGLTVLKAELANDDTVPGDYLKKVTLTTSSQTVGTIYTLTVQNVADVAGNVMDKYEVLFGGYAKDTTKPAAPSIVVTANTKVTVTFAEKMDKALAENIANYTVDNGLTVLKAELDSTAKIITLTTSSQTVGTIYTLTVQNLADISGNVMDKAEGLFGGYAVDTAKPTATVASAANTLTVTYNEEVNAATATNVFNYVFDGGLGYASKATIDTTNKIVTLTTANQTPGKVYTVTINNVADVAGNVIAADTKKTFIGNGSVAAASYTVQAISIVNENTIDVIFDNELTATDAASITVAFKDNGVAYTPAGLAAYNAQQANKKVVRIQYKTTASTNPALFVPAHVYEATVTGNNVVTTPVGVNVKNFGGTNVTNDAPYVMTAVALNKTAVKVVFSEPVKNVSAGAFTITPGVAVSDVSVSAGDVVTEATLYLGADLADTAVYALTFNGGAGLTDAAGFNALKTTNADSTAYKVSFAGTNATNVAPKIAAIVPVDKWTFDIVFTEPVKNAAAAVYGATKVSGAGASLDFANAVYTASADMTKVTVSLDSSKVALASGTVYELTYTPGTIADLQDLAYDTTVGANKVKFGGTDAPNALPTIAAVDATGTKITITLSEAITGYTTETNFFTITIDGSAVTPTAGSIDGTNTVITLTVPAISAGKVGSINVSSAGAAAIKDINKQAPLTTDVVTFGTR